MTAAESGASIERHPLSAAFPSMSGSELGALAADIKVNGLRQPIVLFDGQVLDGWHRYTACLSVGVLPAFVDFDGGDPVAFVISQNAHRRQLTVSQRAIAVATCTDWRGLGANQHGGSAPGAYPLSERALADAADVSERSIRQAKTAIRAGLGEEVRTGKVSVKRAAEIAKLPESERAEALERRAEPRKPAQLAEVFETPVDQDEGDGLDDLRLELEALTRIVEADDKLAEAWGEAKTNAAKLSQLEHLYQGKCAELAEMTRIAARWKRKFEAAEKGLKS